MVTRTVTRTRREPPASGFSFTRAMLPVCRENGNTPHFLQDYSLEAWETYERLPIPSITDEPWRRTDLRGLQAGAFRSIDRQ